MTTPDLKSLLARVEGATGRDDDLTRDLADALGAHNANGTVSDLTASLDAALAIVERVKPGAWIDLSGPRKYLNIPTPVPNHWRAEINVWIGWGATPALALLAALLKALIADHPRQEEDHG